MWRIAFNIFFLIILAEYSCGKNHSLQQELDKDLHDRLSALEELVASQITSQEVLRAALKRETDRRLTLETILQRSFEEERVRIEELTSNMKVTIDRVEALDQILQEEIRFREEAEIKDAMVVLEISKKVNLLERDLSLLSLMKSKLRELEDHEYLQNEEILDMQNAVSNMRKSVTHEQRRLQELWSNADFLTAKILEHSHSLSLFESQFEELDTKFLNINETFVQECALLQESRSRVLHLSERLTELQDSVSNLTLAVGYLSTKTPTTLLKLCPHGYRKFGQDCLQLIESKFSWDEARKKCEELGMTAGGIGDLVIPTNVDNFRAYVERLDTASDYLWVGAKRDDDSVWRWVSGMTLEEKEVPWDLGEPDNYENQYHLCIRTKGNLKFHDCLADAQLSAVCQLK
ncbi:hypothetical protein SK128_016811 [Halocaridina rubra]|uniref:C-type lectin domain-containing protein n=1 Tax=Halocaridina rubra TaxID=373956 RepID=A0AAN9FTN3_HALRR